MKKTIKKVLILSIMLLIALSALSSVRANSASSTEVRTSETIKTEKQMSLLELGNKFFAKFKKAEKKVELTTGITKVDESKVQKPEVEAPKTEEPQVQETVKPQVQESKPQVQEQEVKPQVQEQEVKPQVQEQEVKPQVQEQEVKPQVQEQEVKPQAQEPVGEPQVKEPEIVVPEVVKPQNSHVHTCTTWKVTIEPTCISQGEKTGICTGCGEVVTVKFNDLNAHKLEKIEDVKATCEKGGMLDFKRCTLCHQEFFKYEKPLGHIWSNSYTVDKEATCTQSGVKSHHCTRTGCTATTGQVVISATGHNLVEKVNASTCTTDGTRTTECTKCGHIEKTVVTSQATGHKYENYVSDGNATCTEDGTKTATCKVCGHRNTIKDTGSKKEHNLVEISQMVTATCGKAGKEASKKCTICGKTFEGKTIPAVEHEFVVMSDSVSGKQAVKCIRCHMELKDGKVTFGTGHIWDENGNRCLSGNEECNPETSLWWKCWEKGTAEDRSSCIWWVGFICDMNGCEGFKDRTSNTMKDTIIEGRRGDIDSITMIAPEAREGYVFDGWYELTADGEKKVESSGNGNGTYANGNKITVGWKDMDKGFKAKYSKK